MSGLSDDLAHYLVPDDKTVRDTVLNGLIVVDTNVLLEAYRYQSATRDELLDNLAEFGDRLWIPHQVRLELFRNRLQVMSGINSTYREVEALVANAKRELHAKLVDKIGEMCNRVGAGPADRELLLEELTSGMRQVEKRIDDMRDQHVGGMRRTDDPVLRRLEQIFENRCGEQPTADEYETLKAEAVRRLNEGVPPGFRDANKTDATGDYIIWAQALQEARRRGLPLLFVTRDNKGDWFLNVRGEAVCALPELQEEALRMTGRPVILAQPQTLLIYARNYLHTSVSDATMLQTSASRVRAAREACEVQVGGDVLPVMMIIANEQLRRYREEFESIDTRRRSSIAELASATGVLRNSLDVVVNGLQREVVALDDKVRDAERVVRLIERAHFDIPTRAVIRWHGHPDQDVMESLADRAEKYAASARPRRGW